MYVDFLDTLAACMYICIYLQIVRMYVRVLYVSTVSTSSDDMLHNYATASIHRYTYTP
jgi:hypothetical protein